MERHLLTLEKREKLTITQVTDVDAFDENILWANLKEGSIEITGKDLNIEKLDLEEGILVVKGLICTFSYIKKKHKEKTFLKRITGRV